MREVEGQFGLGDGVAHAGRSWCPGECGSRERTFIVLLELQEQTGNDWQ